jgi:UMF1 family MFS transporter
VLLYVLATVGFSGSISFYDSLLIFVAPSRQLDHISALGYAIGYLGGGLLFAITVGMTLKPELFGLADAAAAVKLAFYLVAIWWGLFTLPLLLWVVEADGRPDNPGTIRLFIDALRELRHTLAEVRKQRMVWLFLLAYWCYIDGVDTIIRMAVDYGLALGFSSDSLIIALLITQFVGFPAALLFGRIGTIRGPKFGIQVAITSYILIIIYAYFMDSEFDFYMMAIAIGLVQGGIQSLSRSLYTRLIPREKSAEFFGFYNVLGKFAALLGPLLIGWISLISHDSRLSILSLIPLFVVGAWLLTKVELEHH